MNLPTYQNSLRLGNLKQMYDHNNSANSATIQLLHSKKNEENEKKQSEKKREKPPERQGSIASTQWQV